MNIISPTFIMLDAPDEAEVLSKIERIARVCYKSEGNISEGSAERLVQRLIDSGHEAMIEHCAVSVLVTTDRGVTHEIVRHRVASYAMESSRYCVDGNAELSYKNPHCKDRTIKGLYNNIINTTNGSYKRRLIKQLDENSGELVYAGVKNVIYMGEKQTIKIKTELGYEITCTPDHLIYTPSGYRETKDLLVGDIFYVNGTTVDAEALYKNKDWLYYQSITLNKTFVEISKEFNLNTNTVKKWAKQFEIPQKGTGYFNIGRIPWNKGMNEEDDIRVKTQGNALRNYHYDSSMRSKKRIILKHNTCKYQKHRKTSCEVCGAEINLEVHHKDKDRSNNEPTNLLTVCESCHMRIHYKSLEILHEDKITSIENAGVIPVYDIEMDSENHNFIANGVVVHNCNYTNEKKFANGITYIDLFDSMRLDPKVAKLPMQDFAAIYSEWYQACEDAERHYNKMLSLGATPQIARSVLNHSTKSEIVITMNFREWRHFFRLRTAKDAHPAMREIAIPMFRAFKKKYPVLFSDMEDVNV